MRSRGFVALVLAAAGSVATAAGSGEPAAFYHAEKGPLTVEIRWSEKVDLDLFLTGPDGETVYFGNREARSGIRMGTETGCRETAKAAPPYVETAIISWAAAGRYRVSVDYIRDCDTGIGKAPFTVRLIDPNTSRELGRAETTVGFRVLETIGWEFDIR